MRGLIVKLIQFLILDLLVLGLTVTWMLFDGLTDIGEKADLALVVDHGANGHEISDAETKAKLDRVVELYNQGLFPNIMVSGASSIDHLDEAPAMSRYLQAHGVAQHVIVEDANGFTLPEIAQHVQTYMTRRNLLSVMIVTAYYQTTRLKLALTHAGVAQIEKSHVGHIQKEDDRAIAVEVAGLYELIGQFYVVPFVREVRQEINIGWEKLQAYLHQQKLNMDGRLNSLAK